MCEGRESLISAIYWRHEKTKMLDLGRWITAPNQPQSDICHQMLWKSGLSFLNSEDSSMEFCLSIWIWQSNRESNGNSLSLTVWIKNFTLNLENVPVPMNQCVLMERKREYFAFHRKFSPLAAGWRSLVVPRVGFSEWDFSEQGNIFSSVLHLL